MLDCSVHDMQDVSASVSQSFRNCFDFLTWPESGASGRDLDIAGLVSHLPLAGHLSAEVVTTVSLDIRALVFIDLFTTAASFYHGTEWGGAS